LAAALQASGAEPPQKTYEVEFAPLAPSERQYAHLGPAGPYFPDRAFRNNQSGEGRLRCTAGVDGDLQGCVEVYERPSGSDFSVAARILADRKRLRAVGAPAVGESIVVRVPFVLGAPAAVMERAVRTTRTFKGSAPDVRGHAEVACVVADKGLDRCFVLYFQSGSRASSATTAAAALAAVSQVSPGELEKATWVIMPVDVTPAATPKP
jgi:hypothetical protein